MNAAAPRSLPPETAEYLTAAQVAGLLQVSEKSVYRWATDDPTLPVLKLGATVRFPRERLARWLRAREQGAGRPRLASRDLALDNRRAPEPPGALAGAGEPLARDTLASSARRSARAFT